MRYACSAAVTARRARRARRTREAGTRFDVVHVQARVDGSDRVSVKRSWWRAGSGVGVVLGHVGVAAPDPAGRVVAHMDRGLFGGEARDAGFLGARDELPVVGAVVLLRLDEPHRLVRVVLDDIGYLAPHAHRDRFTALLLTRGDPVVERRGTV